MENNWKYSGTHRSHYRGISR